MQKELFLLSWLGLLAHSVIFLASLCTRLTRVIPFLDRRPCHAYAAKRCQFTLDVFWTPMDSSARFSRQCVAPRLTVLLVQVYSWLTQSPISKGRYLSEQCAPPLLGQQSDICETCIGRTQSHMTHTWLSKRVALA